MEGEKRGKNGRFLPGHIGNPGGRPKMRGDVKEMLRAAAPDAVRLLIGTMNDPAVKTELRVKCAETVIERVYGKAAQPIEGSVDNRIEIVLGDAGKYAD